MKLNQFIRSHSLRNGLLSAVSAVALSGCVAAMNEQFDSAAAPTAAQVQSQQASVETELSASQGADGEASAIETASAANASSSAENVAEPSGNQLDGLTTQPTGISATQNSIFAAGQTDVALSTGSETGAVTTPAFLPVPLANPAAKSLYQQDLASQAAAIEADKARGQAREAVAAADASVKPATTATHAAQAPSGQKARAGQDDEKTLTLAAFFAAAAKRRTTAGLDSSKDPVTSIDANTLNPVGIALAGRASMGEEFDDEHEEDTPPPAGLMKLASLSSLSRVAPNGLRLQTERVSVACMKPDLVKRIKQIEAHYKSPVIVTSGYRPRVSNVRRGSLHHTCDAADIQVPGVSKWELAKYLRSLPDRGGVGTYCHTESVHLDNGAVRDWNWRCRAPKKK